MRLKDQVAIVTGGSRGIGRAIAGRLAAEGCAVAICGRNAETLERAQAELRQIDGAMAAGSGTSCPVSTGTSNCSTS